VIPVDLDGDGRKDLLAILAYAEWSSIAEDRIVEGVFADRSAAGDGIKRCGATGYHVQTVSKIFEEIH